MRDTIAAPLYVIIVVIATLLYADIQNVQIIKHPLDALAALWDQVTESESD